MFFALLGFVAFIFLIFAVIEHSSKCKHLKKRKEDDHQAGNVVTTANLRKIYSNLYVIAKVKEIAKKDGIDLDKELSTMDTSVIDIDDMVEGELTRSLKKMNDEAESKKK